MDHFLTFARTMRMHLAIAVFASLTASSLAGPTVKTEWMHHFGKRIVTHEDGSQDFVTLMLMRSGWFRAPIISDFEVQFEILTRDATDLEIIDVAEWTGEDPKAIYVWLMRDGRNLNIEMVRKGWFPGGTQIGGSPWRLLISDEMDASFITSLTAAEDEARQNRRGIWASEEEKQEANKAVDPTPRNAPRNSGGSSQD